MLRRVLILTIATVLCLTGLTYAAAIVNEDFSKPLDTAVWRVYTNCDNGQVAVENGALVVSNVDSGWKQKGIMLIKPIDLTGKTTTVEVAYKQAGFNEQDFGFWTEGNIEGDDTWNHPGFRATVFTDHVDFQPTSTFTGNDGALEITSDNSFTDLTAPFTVKWVMKPDKGTVYNIQAFLNGGATPAAEVAVDMGSMDPKAVYFYLYVSNNDQEGPLAVDSVSIAQ